MPPPWGEGVMSRLGIAIAIMVQSNLDYPYLGYLDFLIIQTFSLVPVLS